MWSSELEFEQALEREIGNFKDALTGVNVNDACAAVMLRAEGRYDVLNLLLDGKLRTRSYVRADEMTVDDLEFAVV